MHATPPHSPSMSAPPGTFEHVPALPSTSHARQLPSQASLQHTPSAHTPSPQSLSSSQPPPGTTSGTHVPSQWKPSRHSASLAHPPSQLGAVWSSAPVQKRGSAGEQSSACVVGKHAESSGIGSELTHNALTQRASRRVPWQVVVSSQLAATLNSAEQSSGRVQHSPVSSVWPSQSSSRLLQTSSAGAVPKQPSASQSMTPGQLPNAFVTWHVAGVFAEHAVSPASPHVREPPQVPTSLLISQLVSKPNADHDGRQSHVPSTGRHILARPSPTCTSSHANPSGHGTTAHDVAQKLPLDASSSETHAAGAGSSGLWQSDCTLHGRHKRVCCGTQIEIGSAPPTDVFKHA